MHANPSASVINHNQLLRRHAVSLKDAAADSPVLARLGDLIERSNQHMAAIAPHLPTGLRKSVSAGPINDCEWCLLVRSGSVASKLRQLLPELEAKLLSASGQCIKIRIKVLSP
jgi:hypothetical protein